ncbi:MAG: cation-translocating P-type ATPase [Clostridia bacterium]|nr:cation-translocating P-type ATPase [Clostridia bacterium]
MMKKIEEYFEGIRGTVISGVFLLLSLFIPKIFNVDVPVYLDPAWVSVIISGIPLITLAIRRVIKNKGISKISSALLISVAMISAIIIGDLFAAGEVAFIMAIGEILEDKTTERAKKGLKNLISLQPVQARRVTGESVSVEQIQVGDLIRILPGEAIPVDGEIVSGETSVDQSVMTGESLPVDKAVGDSVFCGTVNRYGSIDIKATKVGEDSSLQKLIRMVREAEDKQAPMQRIADKWASWLVPLAMIIAIISGIVTKNVTVAVTVLVVFCPCALVLATPTAIMAAIGQATKHGIIIKSGSALEKMGKVDTITFDKTGTLTYGNLRVSEVIALDSEINSDALLSITASAESKSEHPLGKAITEFAKEKGLNVLESESFNMEAGKGITATISGIEVYCGSERFIKEKGFTLPLDEITRLRNEGKAIVITATKGKVIGVIALSDTIRDNASTSIGKLRQMGVDTVILTGDNKNTAIHFAKALKVSEVYSELLPEEKVNSILKLRQNGKTVCMVGDGINDAPALKIADVGIAMGTMGSDIAVESADIALVGDDVSKLPYLKRLSNATVNTIKFSISLSLFINLVAIVLSVINVLTPTTGALVHNAGSCFVVLIAALLYDRKFD